MGQIEELRHKLEQPWRPSGVVEKPRDLPDLYEPTAKLLDEQAAVPKQSHVRFNTPTA